MIKSKKQMFVVIGAFALVMLLGSITYAFFNYTRTGTANTIRVGRIAFNSSQSGNINLTNAFPITSSEAETDTTNAKSVAITVTGDTDYSGGVEYVVTASDVNMTVGSGINAKELPLALEISVTGNNSNTLGTEETGDYYTNRDNYQVSKYKIEYDGELEEGSHLLVGYIAPNTTSGTAEGVDGVINIKAYIDASKVLISDTYDGTESDNMGTPNSLAEGKTVFTTTEWNSIQSSPLSFKLKVEANEGIWVEEPLTLSQSIARQVSTASYIASYDDIISSNPTFTTQDQVSTSATKQTVYYYTGNEAAANANVLFAGYCWQVIRTTDNGGVRMIYNGVAVNNKCETTRTATKGINAVGNGTLQSMSAATLYGRSYDYDLTTGEFTIENSTGLPTSWTTNDNNSNGTEDYKELIGTYTCLSNLDTCSTLYYVGSINQSNSAQAYVAKYTIGDVARYSQLGTSAFNSNYYSPALVGYMFNKEYDYKSGSKSGEYYTSAAWENGAYVLSNGNGGTAPDVTHHYICDSDCAKVRYYYYVSGSSHYYILLENGKTVEDALKEMINYKTNANEIDENINVYNSAMKGYLDNWYKKNLTAYTSYLDQSSVYCNDRSIRELGGWNPTNSPSLTTTLQFYQYSANRDLNCVNEWDRFAVTNTKAKLTYPIGLLTEPERNLMTANFAKTGQYYWGASPSSFSDNRARVRSVDATGGRSDPSVSNSYGARGVVSLRPGTKLENGTGTYNDPYIVGPIVARTS